MKKTLTKEEKILLLQSNIQLSESALKVIHEMKMKKISNSFERYCREGDFEMIQYLLTSPDLEMHYDLHYSNVGFTILCEKKQLPIIQYLLTSPELKKHAKIKAGTNIAIYVACEDGNVELVKYLLTSPELNEHSNIYDYQCRAIIAAYKTENEALIDFLIYDYGLDLNKISDDIKDQISELVHKTQLKKLKHNLECDLPLKETPSPKIKI